MKKRTPHEIMHLLCTTLVVAARATPSILPFSPSPSAKPPLFLLLLRPRLASLNHPPLGGLNGVTVRPRPPPLAHLCSLPPGSAPVSAGAPRRPLISYTLEILSNTKRTHTCCTRPFARRRCVAPPDRKQNFRTPPCHPALRLPLSRLLLLHPAPQPLFCGSPLGYGGAPTGPPAETQKYLIRFPKPIAPRRGELLARWAKTPPRPRRPPRASSLAPGPPPPPAAAGHRRAPPFSAPLFRAPPCERLIHPCPFFSSPPQQKTTRTRD